MTASIPLPVADRRLHDDDGWTEEIGPDLEREFRAAHDDGFRHHLAEDPRPLVAGAVLVFVYTALLGFAFGAGCFVLYAAVL